MSNRWISQKHFKPWTIPKVKSGRVQSWSWISLKKKLSQVSKMLLCTYYVSILFMPFTRKNYCVSHVLVMGVLNPFRQADSFPFHWILLSSLGSIPLAFLLFSECTMIRLINTLHLENFYFSTTSHFKCCFLKFSSHFSLTETTIILPVILLPRIKCFLLNLSHLMPMFRCYLFHICFVN